MDSLQKQLTDEIRMIIPIVEQRLGREARWSGHVEIVPTTEFKGMKRFSCDILISTELAQQAIRWSTLIHEVLHCTSAGYNRDDYQAFRGWEEGVVEHLQRLLRSEILSQLSIHVDQADFTEIDATHSYNRYLDALEQLRHILGKESAIQAKFAFYRDLIAVPIRNRPAHILGYAYQQPGPLRFECVRIFSAANAVLIGRPL